jgi:hypothetical protein
LNARTSLARASLIVLLAGMCVAAAPSGARASEPERQPAGSQSPGSQPPGAEPAREGENRDPTRRRGAMRSDEPSPERLRDFLERGIERAKRAQTTLAEGLAMLDRGESPAKVREFTRDAIRAEFIDRLNEANPPRERGPRDRRDRPDDDRPEGPGGPDGPGGADGQRPEPIDPDAAMRVLEEVNPALHERLTRLREERPEAFRAMIERQMPRLAALSREREEDPQGWPDRARLFALERQAGAEARRAASLDGAEQDAAKARLREMLEQMFELRLKVAQSDMRRLERRVQALQQEIDDKAGARDAMIDQRLEQMLRRAAENRDQPRGPDGRPGPRERRPGNGDDNAPRDDRDDAPPRRPSSPDR